MQNTLASHIEMTPDVCGGKPRIAGRRITVHHIAVWHERLGRSADDIAREHHLTLAQVHAALAYYFDNRAEVDAEIRAEEQFVSEMKRQAPSLINEKLGG